MSDERLKKWLSEAINEIERLRSALSKSENEAECLRVALADMTKDRTRK